MTLSHEWEYRGHWAHTPLGVVESFISGFNESAAPAYYWEDLLFHYTSGEDFFGIIESRKMWATHAQCLNDETELTYARELLAETLGRLSGERHPEAPKWRAPSRDRRTVPQ